MSNEKFSHNPAKFLSIFVDRMVPDYVREDHPMFITFMQKYFEYLERETSVNGELGEYTQITDLIENVDIDHALDQFIPEFEKQYLSSTPTTAIDPTVPTTDKAFLTKNIQPTYRQKGTESALDFMFRRDFNTEVKVAYPKEFMWKASGSDWYEPQWINVDGTATNTKKFYNKKIIGQTSGATAFVDIDEGISISDSTKLLLTEVDGSFIQGEEIHEDVGTSGNAPTTAFITSEGIRSDGECSVNGGKWTDQWINITGPRHEVKHATNNTIVGETSGATAHVDVMNVNWTRFNISEVQGEFIEGERVYNTSALNYNPDPEGNPSWLPTESFCSSNNEWPLGTFLTERECTNAMHPEADDPTSVHYGESSHLFWFPFLTVTKGVQTVENSFLEVGTTQPTTREECLNLLDQPNVDTAVWVPNGSWLDSSAFLSSDRKLQDNEYYQDYSYVIKSDVPIQSYREVLKKLVHPVGLKLFAEFAFQSSVDMTVEIPTDYVKLQIFLFSYLDVAMDIWDNESEQHGTLGHAHEGFGVYLDKGFEEYVIEMMSALEASGQLIPAEDWDKPSDHLSVNLEIDGGIIGTTVREKLYTVSWMNDDIQNQLIAFPETTMLEFTKQLKVLPIDEFPPATQELEIVDSLDSTTDGRMISCDLWELGVFKSMRKVLEFIDSFMPEAEYAPEKSYAYFEANRESGRIQNIYGKTNDVIDSVHIGAFDEEVGNRIHSHGREDGFAPLVETVITKGLELPVMDVGASAFHVHYFNGEEIKNFTRHGKPVTARGMNHNEARRLIDRDYFEIPHMHGANLVCGGIMTPPLWGDWVDSQQDPRYNGMGECFNSQYDNPTDCISSYGGNPMFWMPPMCSNMSNMDQSVCEDMGDTWVANPPSACSDGTSPDHMQCEAAGGTWTWETPSYCTSSEASCNAVGHSWGYFTLESLPPMKGHVSYFVKGELVDRQRGRFADPLTREQARQLIDGDVASVTLYDNVGYLDDEGHVFTDEQDITIGGTITNIRGEITSGHYHEYEVTYDPDWKEHTDWQNNPLTHGFVYTPITTWLCFNYDPSLPVDPTVMGGMDFLGNPWPQNVFMDVPDSYVGGFLMNPDITLQHNQVWPEVLNPNVDFVEIYSSNHIAQVPGVGATGDLIGVDSLGTDTDIVVVEAFPSSVQTDTVAIVDQSGIIKLMNENDGTKTTFMDLTSLQHTIGLGPFANYDERGVLGLCFHPQFDTNGKFYVYYMTEQGGGTGAWGFPLSTTVISEFVTDADKLTCTDLSTERNLFTIPQPDFNHNGGELVFGPDGMLYIGLGDGGSAGDTSSMEGHGGHGVYGNAQNPTNLLGTILRVDVTEDTVNSMPYTIPSDNPFINSIYKEGQPEATSFRPEIYAYGFRNPWRFSFAQDGKLWCADVGQDKFEEINIVEAGGNYGWRVMEAYHEYEEDQTIIDQIAIDLGHTNTFDYLTSLKEPIHEYSHGTGISILGGFVYKGSITELQGKYIFGDWSTTWTGTSGHLYTLSENFDGNSAHFNVLPNAINGSTHSHTVDLTGAHVQFLKDNPGSPVVQIQSDTVHSEFYLHTFTIIWSSENQEFVLIGQTNPEGHDVLEFVEYGTDLTYDRTPLSIWDPTTEIVDLTTMGESILTMGETNDGEIIFTTRTGIDTFQGSGVGNTSMYKITDSYNSEDIPTANNQIPSTETAHIHGYEVTYDEENLFQAVEVSDIEMQNYDAFWPIWSWNDPASHIHPVNSAWSGETDTQTLLGSSAGWYYNEDEEQWMPYDIGADTPWAPPVEEDTSYTYIETAPSVAILGANEYGENTHIHYFDSSVLDTYGTNQGRLSTPLTRLQAEELANGVVNEVTIYSSISDSGSHLHYHEFKVLWNPATQQFLAQEVGEYRDLMGTGEWTIILDEQKNHEHTLTVNGITTNLGWNGTPLFTAPDVTLGLAHDWDNLEGNKPDHLHSFNGTDLDTIGVNAGRISEALTDEQTTDLINGDVESVMLYSSIANGDHYHGIRVTYDDVGLAFIAEDVEQWVSEDGAQFQSLTPRTHAHTTEISNQLSINGFNQELNSNDLPVFASPGYPYPGGTHPHFHNGTVVGPFAWNNEIDYADGLSVQNAMDLINGVVEEVIIYDSIEGAHFHDYTVKYDDVENKFYCTNSITWIRGGIEDITQDPLKYYVSVVLNVSEGLHWHNLTIEWNPNDETLPQQTGGAVYVTRVVTTPEVLTSDPQTSIDTSSTELNPIVETLTDTPNVGDTTEITKFLDNVTTTTTVTTTVVTTVTTETYYSDGTMETVVGNPQTTTEQDTSSTTEQVEDMAERQTRINGILQSNNAPIIWIQGTFIDGEGTHDHLLYTGCTLDTVGPFSGRMCEPITVGQANELINAQDVNYGIIFYDSPNGADSHYHGYTIKFNPYIGTDGEFVVEPLNQYDQIPGTGTTIHKFLLTGGFHDHDYWLSVAEYTQLVTGSNITTQQRDTIHAHLYTHDVTIGYSGGQYNLLNQTNNLDGHNLISYVGSLASGGQWSISTQGSGLGDHIHTTIVDETNVWPTSI